MNKLIILSGPSCVGKGPLLAAFRKFYTGQASKLIKLVLYNSRKPRPAEVDGTDYHFRKREEIMTLARGKNFISIDVRGDLQALDLSEVERAMTLGCAFFEGNPYIVQKLLKSPGISRLKRTSIFISPLSRDEISYLSGQKERVFLPDFVAEMMRKKLLRRTTRQKGHLSLKDLEDIERRATSAFKEMQEAHKYDFVLPNHDGEDSENWDAFYYPVGDARRTMLAFAAIVAGKAPPLAEHWSKSLLR